MKEFQIIFSRPLFIIIFRPKILFFVTYSILTGETKVEFVIYWVLNPYATKNVASVIYRMKPLQNAAFWTVASEKNYSLQKQFSLCISLVVDNNHRVISQLEF